jgi:hypothetical protein
VIRPLQERRRDREAEGLGGLEVDRQFVLCWLFDREIAGLRAFEDLVDEERRGSPDVDEVWRVASEPP